MRNTFKFQIISFYTIEPTTKPMTIDIYTTKIKLSDGNLNKDVIPFDTEIKGKHVKVQYTHGSTENDRYTPNFLCFDDKGQALPLYMIGCHSMIDWIKTVDQRISQKLSSK